MGYSSKVVIKQEFINNKLVRQYLVTEQYPDSEVVKCRDCLKLFNEGDGCEWHESQKHNDFIGLYDSLPNVICDKCYKKICERVRKNS